MDSLQEDLILIVDDSPTNATVLLGILQQSGFKVVVANSGETALEKLEVISPSLILLDVILPEMDGFDLCCRLKAAQATCDIPVIFMTSLSNTTDKVKGLNMGAVDYIIKPLQKEEVLARVKVHLKLRNLNKALEEQARELKMALEEVQQSQKMSTLGQLVAGIAHEISNPVTCISANTLYALTYIQDMVNHIRLYQQKATEVQINSHAKEIDLEYLIKDLFNLISSMQESATRLYHLSDSLRIFRNETEVIVPFDLHQGLESTLLILSHRIKADGRRPEIKIIKEYGELPMIRCFPGQINQVFMNLITNAINALRESGYQANLNNQKNPQIWIKTELNLERTEAVICIKDNGGGIPKSIEQKIVEISFSMKPIVTGIGLGLRIAHRIIVEKHGGSLQLNSSIGEGTELIIKLPV
jgi:signal transduction histidine kinase